MKFFHCSIMVILYLFLFENILFSEEVCKFAYKGQPEDFQNGTIVVPDEMVALSEYQYVGIPLDTTLDTINSPAIMFVIDQSGSMGGMVGLGVDQEGNRFSVTRDVIDTLSKIAPGAEVGIAVFNEFLYFDPKDDAIFEQCPEEPVGAYIPLLRLSNDYNGLTGDEVLKKWLECDTTLSPPFPPTVNLKYKPPLTFNASNTHINAGFYAVKRAMLSTNKAKENQFVIFISDGIANIPEDNTVNDYVQGTGVPTTFTIFFVASGTNPPQELTTMTYNIKNNGYSTSNPQSNIWGFKNTGYDTLMTFIMENIIDLIIHQIQYVPVNISINGGQIINNWDSTGFTFPKLFPLLGVTTDFTFDITYLITNDTLSLLRIIPPDRLDTTITTEFKVEIDPAQGPLPDSLYDVKCWDRTLGFYYNGNQVTTIDETMNPLDLLFPYDPGDANYSYTTATIEVTNTSGNGRDIENIALTKNGTTFSGTFPRTVIDDAASPTIGDGTLQHYSNDNIVAVFRNNESPKLPLDTIRIQVPFNFGGTVEVVKAYYFDNNAEGYVDSIYVEATTDIAGGLTDVHVQEMSDNAITLPAFRNFTVNNSGVTTGGFFVKVTEDNAHDPVTYVTQDDEIVITHYIFSTGGEVQSGTAPINDRIAPIIHWEERSALLADYQVASKSDTLSVKFSEPVENVTAAEPFYFLDLDNNTNYSVTLLYANQPKPDSMVFHVVSVSGVSAMKDGDSLWIHETDLVTDTEGNFQNNTGNIKRKLYVEKVYGSVDIASAYYFDNIADGYIDSIYVEATTDIDGGISSTHVSELVNNAITFPGFRGFTATGSGLTSGGFYIAVTEDKGHNPFTYVTSDDKLQIEDYTFTTGGNSNAKTVTIYDRVAPIIHWERKSAYLIDYMVDTVSDTLTVKFSEPVNRVTSDEPFYFLDQDNNTNYIVKLNDVGQPEPDKMAFYVISLSGVDFMEEGDSLWIQEANRVGDTEGNFQNNNKNTRRKLYVDRRVIPYDFNPVAISPINLANIHVHKIPPEVIAVLESQGILDDLNLQQNANGSYVGMLIMAIPDPENIGNFIPDLEVEGHISIFDAVGNQVVLKNRMAWWHQKKILLYVWNVKNENGRTVGEGSYLAVIEIEDITPSLANQNGRKKKVKRILIGVGSMLPR